MGKFLDGCSEGEGVNNLVDVMCLDLGEEIEFSKGLKEIVGNVTNGKGNRKGHRVVEVKGISYEGKDMIENRYSFSNDISGKLFYTKVETFRGSREEWERAGRLSDFDSYQIFYGMKELRDKGDEHGSKESIRGGIIKRKGRGTKRI